MMKNVPGGILNTIGRSAVLQRIDCRFSDVGSHLIDIHCRRKIQNQRYSWQQTRFPCLNVASLQHVAKSFSDIRRLRDEYFEKIESFMMSGSDKVSQDWRGDLDVRVVGLRGRRTCTLSASPEKRNEGRNDAKRDIAIQMFNCFRCVTSTEDDS